MFDTPSLCPPALRRKPPPPPPPPPRRKPRPTIDAWSQDSMLKSGSADEPLKLTRLEKQKVEEFHDSLKPLTELEKYVKRAAKQTISSGYAKFAAKVERRKEAERRAKEEDDARGEQELGAEAAWFRFFVDMKEKSSDEQGNTSLWHRLADSAKTVSQLLSQGVRSDGASETLANITDAHIEIPRTRWGDPDWLPNGRCIGCTGKESTGCCSVGVNNPFT
ncbi:hypothetical protein RI054_07g39410 [Pseudoscourfieldia marina]